MRISPVVARSLKVSLVVGTILNLINSGDVLFAGQVPTHPWKIALTYLVPFLVSCYASCAERRNQ